MSASLCLFDLVDALSRSFASFSDIMGCTSTKASKAEGDLERYHQDIFTAAQTGDVKRLKEILDELDRRKASSTKKDVLNMGT